MTKIGIIGNFLKTAEIISHILKNKSYSVNTIDYKHFFSIEKNDIDFILIGINSPYISSDYINKLKVDILIINDFSQMSNFKNLQFSNNNLKIILINSDKQREIELKTKIPFYVITFGFNPKSTITISSITSGTLNTLQICIQRNLPSLSGEVILEQDFSVNTNNKNPNTVLAGISALLLSGIKIDTIKDILV